MLDPLLAPFAEAEDDAAAAERLAELLEGSVLPLVRRIAGRKLRAYGDARPEDVEDVVGDASLVLVDRLSEVRTAPGAAPIASVLDYAAAVAFTACAHHVRKRHPERARLKNRIRYVLARRAGLAVWHAAGHGAVCGLREWEGRPPAPAAAEALRALAETPARTEPVGNAAALGRRVEALLRPLGGPVELDAFVGAVARLFRVDAPRAVPLGDLPAPGPTGEQTLDGRRAVERTWRAIGDLPVRQRAAVLLNLRDAAGASLLWLFPVLGVASIRAIASVLGWADTELAEVWARLPLDDRTIAERLGCTRQQVINLRQAARKRLLHRTREPGAGGPSGNRGPVPSSLESDA